MVASSTRYSWLRNVLALSREEAKRKGQYYKEYTQRDGNSVQTTGNPPGTEKIARAAKHISRALSGFLGKHQVNQEPSYGDVEKNQHIL